MDIVGKDKLVDFKERYKDAQSQIESWEAEVEAVEWQTNIDIRKLYASASFLGGRIVIFNIKGNKYRLKVRVSYKNKTVLILRVGTHEEYNSW